MKLTVNGHDIPAQVIDENGTPTGYASAYQVLQAYGIPVRLGDAGELLMGVRAFAEVLQQDHEYSPADHHYLIDSRPPLPALPQEPVGGDQRPWVRITSAIASGPMDRSPERLERVLRQFQVSTSPRYRADQQGKGETYCNIYLRDVTQALGCEIPHVVDGQGNMVPLGRGTEQDANAMIRWMHRYGPGNDWMKLGLPSDALELANQGRPVVILWYADATPYIGHVAMVRPGDPHPSKGMPIAQAGATNFDDGYLVDGFGGRAPIEFWVHG